MTKIKYSIPELSFCSEGQDLSFERASKVEGSVHDQCTMIQSSLWLEAKPDFTSVIFIPAGEAW